MGGPPPAVSTPPWRPSGRPSWRPSWRPAVILLGPSLHAIRPLGHPRPFFDGLQPLAYAAAAYGIVPIAFRPIRVCFHPRRSTLLYALLTQGVLFWRVVLAWDHRVPGVKELGNAIKFEDWAHKFVAAHSMGHLLGWLIVPTMWMEGRRVAHLDAICQTLMRDFGHVLSATASPCRVRAWIVAAAVCVPLYEATWMAIVEHSFAGAPYAVAHVYINSLLLFGVAATALCCMRVRTFGTDLARAMRRELLSGHVSPQRAVAFRHAWMLLSDLNGRLIATPISMCLVVAMLVFLIALHLYEGLEKLTSDQSLAGLIEIFLGLPFLVMMFVLCDMPHRSAEAIRHRFLEVLQRPYNSMAEPRTCEELHQFLEIVWWNNSATAVSNYFELKRTSFNAILAVVVTYSMVMLQFHLSINTPCRPLAANVSESRLV